MQAHGTVGRSLPRISGCVQLTNDRAQQWSASLLSFLSSFLSFLVSSFDSFEHPPLAHTWWWVELVMVGGIARRTAELILVNNGPSLYLECLSIFLTSVH